VIVKKVFLHLAFTALLLQVTGLAVVVAVMKGFGWGLLFSAVGGVSLAHLIGVAEESYTCNSDEGDP
jgi:hypothetical protein